MSSTASHARTSRGFARRATTFGAAVAAFVVAASVLTGGVAGAAPSTVGGPVTLDVSHSGAGKPGHGNLAHLDCGVCILFSF